MRISNSFIIADADDFRKKLSAFAADFPCFALLDSCANSVYGKPTFDYALAAGAKHSLALNNGSAFEQLKQFRDLYQDYCFGFLGYDLKNETEILHSNNSDIIGWPEMIFFIPEIYIEVKEHVCTIQLLSDDTLNAAEIFEQINSANLIPANSSITQPLQSRIPPERYLQKVRDIIHHIAEGDIYELNFCQEFYTSGKINPIAIFNLLCNLSEAPFSVLFKWNQHFLISASPERFMQKRGDKVISQPIKGTHKRSADNNTDQQYQLDLLNSTKDKAEHVMIVDLVRNDLTKHAITGSVQVDKLFGIYSFRQVHQMVSTVSAVLQADVNVVDVIKDAFPMGSMTGAPKVMAMQLIEQYEATKRGLYSGAFGYFTPDNDFDFNVVIRSILYDAATQNISIQTGGAIVYDSVPEMELEECYLKLAALQKVLFA